MLAGAASAQANDRSLEADAKSDIIKPVKKQRQSAIDGYSTLPPKTDPGRYKNLPGKDRLNSKALFGI